MATAKVRFVCVSDTHNAAPGEGYTLPKGDVLIHAGDLTNQGGLPEIQKAMAWLEQADFAVKLITAGNHDLSLDPKYTLSHEAGWSVMPSREDVESCRKLISSVPGVRYLQHTEAVNWAFQYPDAEAESLWRAVPADVDILITHTPPAGICDTSAHWKEGGCTALTDALARLRPALHVCGHAHEGRGATVVDWDSTPSDVDGASRWAWLDPGVGSKKQSLLDLTGARGGGTALQKGTQTAIVNAAVMARSFGRGPKAFNKPIVVDLLMPDRPELTLHSARG